MKNRQLTNKGTTDDLVNESIRLSNEDFNENYAEYYNNPTVLDVPDIRSIMADSLNNYQNIIAATPDVSSNYKTKNQQLIQIFMNSANSPTPVSYEDFRDQIISYENSILNSNNLPQNEKDALLSISSIARYSAYYWYNELGNEAQTGFSFTGKHNWWEWLIVGVCDVAGGIGGAAGGVGGAIAGAAGASSGASTLIDWANH